VTTIVL